jgi:uncharacterized GH25 family protein
MKRFLAVLTLFVLAVPAQAHFVWLAPHDGGSVRMVFSEDTEPDPNVPIAKIAQTQVQVRTGASAVAAEKTAKADHYLIQLSGSAPAEVGAVCEYGVLDKSGAPFLLCYYAKTLLHGAQAQGLQHPLEVFPVAGTPGAFEVRWQGKPAAGLEIYIYAPEQGAKKLQTDAAGRAEVKAPKSGLILVRAKHVEAKAGQRGGKEFKEVRHYATLTVARSGPGRGSRRSSPRGCCATVTGRASPSWPRRWPSSRRRFKKTAASTTSFSPTTPPASPS